MKKILFIFILGILLSGNFVFGVEEEYSQIEDIQGLSAAGTNMIIDPDNPNRITQFTGLKTENRATDITGINPKLPSSAEFNENGILTKAEFSMTEAGTIKINGKYYEIPKGTFKFEIEENENTVGKITGEKGYSLKYGDNQERLTDIVFNEKGTVSIGSDGRISGENFKAGNGEVIGKGGGVIGSDGRITKIFSDSKVEINKVLTTAGAGDVDISYSNSGDSILSCSGKKCVNFGDAALTSKNVNLELKQGNPYAEMNANNRIKIIAGNDAVVVTGGRTFCTGDYQAVNGNYFLDKKGTTVRILTLNGNKYESAENFKMRFFTGEEKGLTIEDLKKVETSSGYAGTIEMNFNGRGYTVKEESDTVVTAMNKMPSEIKERFESNKKQTEGILSKVKRFYELAEKKGWTKI